MALKLALLAGLAAATNFLPTSQLLANVEDQAWFEANVPILDVPDTNIAEIYYFRWQTYKEHLFYTGTLDGYLSTEFLLAVGYGGPYGGIVAAAGHHIHEGRWLRDQRYGRNEVDYWLRGPGTWPKPANYELNNVTTDWAHEYSFWAASSVLAQAEVTGNNAYVIGHLDNLGRQYDNWAPQFNSDINLYWQTPVWDATEYTVASYKTSSDPYHGGSGYRPTINSFQYGDAAAIATIAKLAGNSNTQSEYGNKAAALQTAVQNILWDKSDSFFKHCALYDNPDLSLLLDREYMGFLPWQFNLPAGGSDSVSFAQLQDSQGFQSTYGPTTAEQRSNYYYYQATQGCCRWDGPSWPYATAGVLGAVENLLNNYPATSSMTAANYYSLLHGYTMTHYGDGQPAVYEAHDAYGDFWIYNDTTSGSADEDYNHSTYVQNILAGLIGLRAQSDNTLVVNPLVPSSWSYFGVENVAYHGHNITVLWDQTGSHYNQGQGLRVWVDGSVKNSSSTLTSLTVNVGNAIQQPVNSQINIAANPLGLSGGSSASATYTSSYGGGNGGDQPKHVIDGLIFRVGTYTNTRWTTYQTPNPSDTLTITFQEVNAFNNINLYFYSDGGGVQIPSSFTLQYLNSNNDWVDIPEQSQSGQMTTNSRVKVTFPEISSNAIRVTAPTPSGDGVGWGLSEVEVWTAPMYLIQNYNSNLYMGVAGGSTASEAQLQQQTNDGNNDQIWQLIPQPGGWWLIQNYNSGKALSVAGSTTDSTNLVQETTTGYDSQLWRFQDPGDADNSVWVTGKFALYNKFSGKVAGVTDESTSAGAAIVQFDNTPTPDHWWYMIPAVPAGASSVGVATTGSSPFEL